MVENLQSQIEKRRKRIAKQIKTIITTALDSTEAFQRLLAITDEEWQAAIEADGPEGEIQEA